jgi:hypothetical protein
VRRRRVKAAASAREDALEPAIDELEGSHGRIGFDGKADIGATAQMCELCISRQARSTRERMSVKGLRSIIWRDRSDVSAQRKPVSTSER